MDLNNKLILCPKEVSRIFLFLKRKDPYLNFTLFSLSDLQKEIFGSYDKDAIRFLLQHTSQSIKSIKEELNYIQRGINPTCSNEIKEVYDLLDKNGLLEKNDLIKELFKNNDVLVIGYVKDNVEVNHILNILSPKSISHLSLEEVIASEDKTLIEFKSIDEEIRYVFNSIIDSDIKTLEKGEKPQKKCIVCDDNKYEPYLRTYSHAYNIKLYFKNSKSIINSSISKDVLKQALLGNDLNFYLNSLKETASETELDEINLIENTINTYLIYEDENGTQKYVNNLYENLKFLLSEIKIKEPHCGNEIIVTSSVEFNPNVTYYVLGASDTFIPSLTKNNKLLDDSILESNNINSSRVKNLEIEMIAKNFINSLFVKHISYYVQEGKDINYNTNFISKDKIIKATMLKYDYSISSVAAYYSKAIDVENKYGEKTFDLNYKNELVKNKIDVKPYDSSFTGVSQINSDRKLSFSYTSLSSLYLCPFRYYLDYVLNIGIFEDTFNSKLGKFVHTMFENVMKYDFNKSYDNVLSIYKEQFDKKELLLLEANKKRIQYGYENLRKHIYTKDVEVSEHEYRKTYNVKEGDNSLTVNGSIDNFIVLHPNREIMILDYKTGGYNVGNDEEYKNGINLQLLMYSYMLYKDPEYKNLKIAGIYYCPIITKELNFNSQKFIDSYKLDGLTFIDGHTNSEAFNKKSCKINEISIDYYRELVEEKVKNAEQIVRHSKFNITPFVNKKNDACQFCQYYSICYKNHAKENMYRVDEEEKNDNEAQ